MTNQPTSYDIPVIIDDYYNGMAYAPRRQV